MAFLNERDVSRCQTLGKVGEMMAPGLLKRAGFKRITDLNERQANYPWADFYAERHSIGYVISVKARNKWERPPRPGMPLKRNSRFKPGKAQDGDCLELMERAQEHKRRRARRLCCYCTR